MCLLSLMLAEPGCTGRIPKSGPTRESGQSGLMNETFAAKNACNPENHLRPFIIEWDATDRSSFEAYAANNVVVVRYEGCNMTVLEECRNDSVRGEQGAYKPVEWTSGALEKLNISNQGELVAKLPLSVGTLGGRVAGGEKFSMEYFVAGTRNSTRSAVYREDLAGNPGCEGATHFVYGFNLGAFALGSVTEFVAEAGVSLYGFGAGGKNERSRTADKQGGDLGTCKGDSAKDVDGCKSPIRLTLRPIREGKNPEKEAMKAPESQESLNAAGVINAKMEMSEEARSRMEAAQQKLTSRDGKGCLAELDAYDKLEPNRKSTDGKNGITQYRAWCLMAAGKCDAGKALARKVLEELRPAADELARADRQVGREHGVAALPGQDDPARRADQGVDGADDGELGHREADGQGVRGQLQADPQAQGREAERRRGLQHHQRPARPLRVGAGLLQPRRRLRAGVRGVQGRLHRQPSARHEGQGAGRADRPPVVRGLPGQQEVRHEDRREMR
ncbi:hypothetical protein [Nannocystis pusilla]|uniref:hypothetical protein n=1 Tax=Nannocystis pusilla TaxID=889268 RepID=UPI003DA31003